MLRMKNTEKMSGYQTSIEVICEFLCGVGCFLSVYSLHKSPYTFKGLVGDFSQSDSDL